jgi:hypothetical protein
MDMIYEIRWRYLLEKQTVTAIAKDMGLSRPTHLLTTEEPKYTRALSTDRKSGKNWTLIDSLGFKSF